MIKLTVVSRTLWVGVRMLTVTVDTLNSHLRCHFLPNAVTRPLDSSVIIAWPDRRGAPGTNISETCDNCSFYPKSCVAVENLTLITSVICSVTLTHSTAEQWYEHNIEQSWRALTLCYHLCTPYKSGRTVGYDWLEPTRSPPCRSTKSWQDFMTLWPPNLTLWQS